MFDIRMFSNMTIEEKYNHMLTMLESLVCGDESILTKLSNASALINALVDRINWCGFYLVKDNELILGPFQGLPACTKIKFGIGVCGTAWKEKKTMRIENVHCFEGHIACDAASNSEIVLPIIKEDIVYGVLDIDSAEIGRFSDIEEKYLEQCIDILKNNIDFKASIF